MKTSILILFSIHCLLGNAQITGKVQNKQGGKVEFATIFNLTQKKSCITNANGIFLLQGEIGDSVIVQHLNYESKAFILKLDNDLYILAEKNIHLKSINISPAITVDLLKKSCRNTFEKLAMSSVSKVYFDYTLLNNEDTAHVVKLELDVVHQKRKNLEAGENFKSYVVEKQVKLDTIKTGNIFFSNYIGRPLNLFVWKDLTKGFNITKTEDSLNIEIHCYLKESVSDSIMNWIILIDKKDTCLHTVSMLSTLPFRNKKGTIKLSSMGSFQFVKFKNSDNNYYLDEVINSTSIRHPDSDSIYYTAIFHYKTYQIGKELEKRKNSKYIPNDTFISKQFKN